MTSFYLINKTHKGTMCYLIVDNTLLIISMNFVPQCTLIYVA